MAQLVFGLCFFGIFIAFGVWVFRWQYRRADERLYAWAEYAHFKVLDKVPANPIGTGPRAARASNKQVMYKVTLLDAQGVRRRALIKIGSEPLGVLAEDFVVQWEHEPG